MSVEIAEIGVRNPKLEQTFDRMRTAPNRVRKHSPGPNPESIRLDWRATLNGTRTCTVVTCNRDEAAKGMCLMHYKRARTAANPAPRFSLANLDSRLDHDGPVPAHRRDLGPCWTWTGATSDAGYGIAPAEFFGTRLTHRIALALKLGRAVQGVAMHECDNPPCARPSHLKEGTQLDNMADSAAKGRARGGRWDQTHCINGHGLTGANARAVIRSDGYSERLCLACRKDQSTRQAASRKAARHERKKLSNGK